MSAVPVLVLASASATRRRLLEAAGVPHDVDPADVDEAALRQAFGDGDPAAVAQHLADRKAETVSARRPDRLVVGADQVLVCDGMIFAKPDGMAGARAHLTLLSGRPHTLIAAVSAARRGRVFWRTRDLAILHMRVLSPDFIDHYLTMTGHAVTAHVGAYALEGLGAQLFERVDGDYFTILGLPLLNLLAMLRVEGMLAT